jgi:hypothetical protein
MQLITFRRQGVSFNDIAIALNKTVRGVAQKYIKLMPPSNSPSKAKKSSTVEFTEEMKISTLSAVASAKTEFWAGIAKRVGHGATGAQCEQVWNDEVRNRR